MPDLDIRLVAVTDHDTPELLADVAEYVRLVNAVCSHDAGHDDFSTSTIAEALGMLRDRVDRRHDLFVAERDGRFVGAMTTMRLVEGAEQLETDLMVDPARPFDDAVADALLDVALAAATAEGLDTVQTWSLHRGDAPDRPLVPSTGFGALDVTPMTAFLAGRGFTLEQVERNSRFDLQGPPDRVEAMLAESLAAAGADYRVVSFTDACPDELVDSYAATVSRMSTDPPAGGMVVEADVLDAARIRRREARMLAQGLTSSVTLAVHAPTGEVAAFNELIVGEDRSEAIQQYGTLVLPEHRGHRLGAVVKCAGLLRIRGIAPESPCVTTFNAEENAHMLAINVAVGFTPASYAGAWQLTGVAGSAGRSGWTGS